MNQAILFNDDFVFDIKQDAWRLTAQLSGQKLTIYFHSRQLKQLGELNNSTKFDLEEYVELWLERNEFDGDVIHLKMN